MLLAITLAAAPAAADDATPQLAVPQGQDAFLHLKPGYEPSPPPPPAPPPSPEFLALKDRADKGDAEAQLDVGEFYFKKFKDPTACGADSRCTELIEALREAEKYLRKAAATGSAKAEEELGDVLVFKNSPEAADWYLKAANQDDADAMNKLGGLYDTGHTVAADSVAAQKWYRRAAGAGHVAAESNLGRVLMMRPGYDAAEAAKWLLPAALAGSADAQYSLGALYEKGGRGLAANPQEAFRWYKMAAEQGNMLAQTQMARAYAEGGRGVAKDDMLAYFWYFLATSANPNALEDPVVRARDEVRRRLTRDQVYVAEALAHSWRPKKP